MFDDIKPKLSELATQIFQNIPSGLGSRRKDFKVTRNELDRIALEGVNWIIEKKGLGWAEDTDNCEENGFMKNADPDKVSQTAKDRGEYQIGTLGSGNHFVEIQKLDRILDPKTAKVFGLSQLDQVAVMIHTGSRGFGHQICSDYLQVMEHAMNKYKIVLPDRELACAPSVSSEAEDYYKAMASAVNFAFSNRQAITHWVRQSFEQVFHVSSDKLGLKVIYDVAHNIAKIEEHKIDGVTKKVIVHRKGATRAFPPDHPAIPSAYRSVGQPVIIPGSMGTSSWVMVGAPAAMDLTWGSTAHGAGRRLSRAAAKRQFWGNEIKKEMENRGMAVRAASSIVLAEEADPAYKNVDEVAQVSHDLQIATKVARFVPLAVIKG
jgi:tRNA-splicing ligase RtcB (3'-phosphate/5'-hydroxy nucleic acid ligase)